MNKGPGNWFNGLPRTEFTTLDLCGGWREPAHSPPNIQPPNTHTHTEIQISNISVYVFKNPPTSVTSHGFPSYYDMHF